MKVVFNNFIPFKGFKAINLFNVLFVRKGTKMKPYDYNHEAIHTAQMAELAWVFFYLIYIVEFIYHLIVKRNWEDAYRAISFEKEALANQTNYKYLIKRKPYAQWRTSAK